MTGFDVRIETLFPMRVASVRVVSEHPEEDAWRLLASWAEPLGLLADPAAHQVFGFNNPNPSPGAREYGYEFWLRVDPAIEASGSVAIEEVPGGRFAVLRHSGYPDPDVWRRLWEWAKAQGYEWGGTHELERMLTPAGTVDPEFDLYLPITESRGRSESAE